MAYKKCSICGLVKKTTFNCSNAGCGKRVCFSCFVFTNNLCVNCDIEAYNEKYKKQIESYGVTG